MTNGSGYYIIVKRNRNELENERIKNILNKDGMCYKLNISYFVEFKGLLIIIYSVCGFPAVPVPVLTIWFS